MTVERESVNFKRTKILVEELRAKAKELNTSATELVAQGIRHVLEQTEVTDNSIEDVLHHIISRLETLSVSKTANGDGIESGIEQCY